MNPADRAGRLLASALGLHLLANALHGGPHALVPVPLTAVQQAFVGVVVFVVPVLAYALARRRSPGVGGLLFALAALASLAFGAYFYYAVPNPDNVAQIPAGAWRLPFRATAALLVPVDAFAAAAGARLWLTSRSPSDEIAVEAARQRGFLCRAVDGSTRPATILI